MVARRPAHCRGKRSLGSESGLGVEGRGPRRWLFGLFLTFMVACAAPAGATAEPFKATVSSDVSGGYARLVFHLSDEIDARAHHHLRQANFDFTRPLVSPGIGLYWRGTARSRRSRHPRRVGAQGDGQLHHRRRQALCRSLARYLERTAPRAAAGSRRGIGAPRSRGRTA